MGLSKNKEEEFNLETNDLLIVFDDEKKTSDIRHITETTDEAVIAAGYYKVPLQDCEITVGNDGRNFFYRAPSRSVTETERLAQLEMNTVLTQITAYRPPVLPSSLDWTKGILFALIFIAFIIIALVAT
ncbi:hypothetical protein MUN88_14240 [Gracilibacillus caseinilyticus]|uniref:Uncharacterized protein n=1 Tax=Gracilibacillus caseinilyticus TaxID=2932256 RepID=A0ABY4ES13_9BACI|nr:hypothetical protein [Gracilibacillus caseinilyticus]UOQ47226.1 hypothetical protein MUN88_14240 [Gracilibacillus caseinilyticus]